MNFTSRLRSRKFLLPALALLLLWIVTRGYYAPYFSVGLPALLALFFVILVSGHYGIGYRLFQAESEFPLPRFLTATLVFSGIRWLYTYFILRHHLPSDTVFYHSDRVLWFIIPTSAMIVFLGYAIAQYGYMRRSKQDVTTPQVPHRESARIQFRSSGKEIRLPVDQLMAVSARGEYVVYHCGEVRYPRYQRLKEAEAELTPLGFVRVHRSHLVARRAIRTVSGSEIELTNGMIIPVSRTYRKNLN